MNEKFSLEMCGDLDFEEMVVDVYYGKQRIALITQEEGLENMKVSLSSSNPEVFLPLDGFIEALIKGQKWLIKCQKLPDSDESEKV